jgi:aldose sugar dehydrogenase
MKAICLLLVVAVAACGGTDASSASSKGAVRIGGAFIATPVAEFQEPWAMTFLPDGRLLVTEKKGALKLLDVESKRVGDISGVPQVAYGGQGGFGDVILHPQFAANSIVYVSYSEAGQGQNNGDNNGGTNGAAVARARLELDPNGGGSLKDLAVIWRQVPKVSSRGHWGHRLAFGPDGMLWITSSERQQFTPAQDMKGNLGKIVRVKDDGSVPTDNPFYSQGGVTAQIWSLGHRNLLGIAFAPDGRLYAHEMGPAGGDELNIIEKGANYGYPVVSNGNHYNGSDIPDHPTRPEFRAPLISWTPVISPAGFIIYSGKTFPQWVGNGFIGGLSSESLVRVEFGNGTAREAQRFDMGRRIREVEQGPDGAIWLLEDQRNLTGGRLLKLTP